MIITAQKVEDMPGQRSPSFRLLGGAMGRGFFQFRFTNQISSPTKPFLHV